MGAGLGGLPLSHVCEVEVNMHSFVIQTNQTRTPTLLCFLKKNFFFTFLFF